MIGLIGKKIGMTQVFDETGILTPVTVIEFEPNVVVGRRDVEKHGYKAVVMGAFEAKESRLAKPFRGQFKDPVTPKKVLREIRDFDKDCAVGDSFGIDLFEGIRFVDVQATSKGKGYQGVVKKYGFKGGRATHGSKFHRAHGSTGQNTQPAHTFKGVRMAGRMGGVTRTAASLRVIRIDPEKRVLLVRGAVPGSSNSVVFVTDATKKV